MKVLLLDVDSRIPNVALMKLSAHHKRRGDQIFLNHCANPDWAYVSCVFSKNRAQALGLEKLLDCPVTFGGYGINDNRLPDRIEHIMPDYSLYPGTDFSMGWTSRGCIRKCPFCLVWRKEGAIRDHASIGEFWNPEHKKVMLLDNNFLASPNWKQNIEFILQHQLHVSICQGLDIRLVDDENAFWLKQIDSRTMSFKNPMYYFAFDDPALEDAVRTGVATLKKHGIQPYRLTFYILCGYDTTHKEDMRRFEVVRELRAWPYIMKFNDRNTDPWLNDFDRWVNSRIHKSCSFKNYRPRKPSIKEVSKTDC